jgi:hypothetical protein
MHSYRIKPYCLTDYQNFMALHFYLKDYLIKAISFHLTGLLYDVSGSYDHTFLAGGIFIAFSGLLLIFVPIGKCLKLFVTRKRIFSYKTPEWWKIVDVGSECLRNWVLLSGKKSVFNFIRNVYHIDWLNVCLASCQKTLHACQRQDV